MTSSGRAADRDALVLRHQASSDLVTRDLHDILQLRSDVFVVEQECVYPDVDGRDLEPETRHLWLEDSTQQGVSRIAAYVRVLQNNGARQIGRVVTHPQWRRQGLAADLVRVVLAEVAGPWTLEAQSHLADYYASLGFDVCGPEYIEDGIPHVPMRREVTA